MKLNSVASRRGQNTAEYLILLVLVAVGAIAIFGAFGKSLKQQVGSAIYALEGGTRAESETVSGENLNNIMDSDNSMNINGQDMGFSSGETTPPAGGGDD